MVVVGSTSIADRFEGAEGRRRLAGVLRDQRLVNGDAVIAARLADIADVVAAPAGQVLISQTGTDTDVYFIIDGDLSIQVNGREIARRGKGQHVGEMAAIDPTARRSASVVCVRESVVARVRQPAFIELADDSPRLWQAIAIQLAERLRQRSAHVKDRRVRPHIFVGSSSESLAIAEAMRDGLLDPDMEVQLWTTGVFELSHFVVEDLERQVGESDFAALIIGPDDKVQSRGVNADAPRDNVVFELGLFMGALGHRRTFIIAPKGKAIKLPTDLLGLIHAPYDDGPPETLAQRMVEPCKRIREAIAQLGGA